MSTVEKKIDSEVIIVGGGPVGHGLAIELGQRGIRSVLVERHKKPQPVPKGQNLTSRTMEHFHFWGAEKQLRAARTIPPEYGIGGLTTYGTLLGQYSYDWLQRDLVKSFYYQANERLPQYATEAVLRDRTAQLDPVQTFYGWSAESVQQDANGATVTIKERNGTAVQTLRAAYVVGCDGSRSKVREDAEIDQTLTDHDRLMVLLVFRSKELHRLLERYPNKSYYNVLHPDLKGYWKFFGRVDLGNTWFFHAPVPVGTTATNFDFHSYLHGAVGASFDVDIEYTGFWDLRFALADSYRNGRIFIAGDAAHSHPPYGGYGINSGLEDACNLGWKLAAALKGWGNEKLLDSYDAERRPVFRSTIDDFIAKSIETDRVFLNEFDPNRDPQSFEEEWGKRAKGAVGEVNAFEPNYEGSPVVCNSASQLSSAKGSHKFQAQPGHHLAPAILDGGRQVYESLGSGFTLLTFGVHPLQTQKFVDAAKDQELPLTVVIAPMTGEAVRYEASLILVRPDQFVAWSTSADTLDLGEVRKVLAHVKGNTDYVWTDSIEIAASL